MGYRIATIVQPGSNNTKIAHGSVKSVRACGISLAASDSAGFNVCSRALPKSKYRELISAGATEQAIIDYAHSRGLSTCSIYCVTSEAGRGRFDTVREPRANLTRWYIENRQEFKRHMLAELWAEHGRLKSDQIMACRPNIDSDVPWERTFPEMFEIPCEFYDYTKVSKRLGKTPDNYHLTYSVNDGTTLDDWEYVYSSGCNISVVYNSAWQPSGKQQYHKFGVMPTWYTDPFGKRWRVIDGDKSDFRFLDDNPVCVGLRLKGGIAERAFARVSGFAHNLPVRLRKMVTNIHPSFQEAA